MVVGEEAPVARTELDRRAAPLRILFMTPLYFPWPGGLELLTRDLVAELRGRGHAVSVITSQGGDEPTALEEVDGVPVLRTDVYNVFGRRDRAGFLRTQRAVIEHARAFAPDVVHGHDTPPSVWMYLRAPGRTRAPVVLTLHVVMTRHLAGSEAGLGLLRTLLRDADWITAVSGGVARDATAVEPSIAGRISVVPSGMQPPRPEPPPIPESPPRIVCVGRVVEQKGFDRAVAALALIARHVPNVRMTIVGDGPGGDALGRQASALGVDAFVERIGHVERERVLEVLTSATLVMMPSMYEGLPLVAMEAAWMGRPVVASRVPSLDEAVVDGETGLLVEPDAESLAAAALRLIGDRGLAQTLGHAARRRAEREWTLATCADRYEAVYRRSLLRH